ncbi:MAG: Crp/Fnr family transcriptional regulator [Devosia sp.]|nr:Crp/Fnr family transcriptional regulator [Devosia sp.]
MSSSIPTVLPLVTKLRNYAALSPQEEQVLDEAVAGIREYESGQDIVVEGTSPNHSSLLLSGLAGRFNMSVEGKRQITSLHIAGDFVDLHSFLIKPMDHSIVALGTCRIATVPHATLTAITEQHPRLTRLLWLNTLIDAGTHRRWEFCLGTLQGHQHLAHLVCEMYLRLKQISQADNNSFHLPITQGVLSECLAQSVVHTNRVVQQLRAENVISWERDLITIKDWDRLAEMGEFDPTYLRMPVSDGLTAA